MTFTVGSSLAPYTAAMNTTLVSFAAAAALAMSAAAAERKVQMKDFPRRSKPPSRANSQAPTSRG